MEWLNGLIDLPWWGYVLVMLLLTHMTIASVTIFLHRHQAHRALDLHPVVSHFFRFWLWLTTAQVTKEWAAIHRKHHAKCETAEDPHSPQIFGIKKVFWEGWELYRTEAARPETMQKYGHGTPDDWLERKLYSPHASWGPVLMAVIDLVLFGANGIWIWAMQMLWIPVTAAGVINGIGHYWGYRNFETEDASTNIMPWGILIGGEELHNNHHTFGTSAKLSYKWFEFDIGWLYIRILSAFGLAKVRKVAPKLVIAQTRPVLDESLLQAIIANRYAIAANYARTLKATVAQEIEQLSASACLPTVNFDIAKRMKVWLKQDAKDTSASDKIQLELILAQSKVLAQVYQMRQELTRIWERSSLNRHELVIQLQDWCARAEASGIQSLREFSLRLRAVA
ncbi:MULTISPECIES: DesA family fatty acid desaturase [Deefgea]|uniref:Acyl-CoA desaturase n=1 Tax=Deefgea chitinilytica TaxID=570276 RepID=A0ABS2CFD3_9NEIS|nr:MULTISPECIES: fatty acid desaturase [Deefgea]MBM5572866.1 acyl-CoA desaturase [Deefgea chitinilytica]MBM9890103.1 fatty acid desaturase [Deefgea sp. CFH1-16]